MPSAMEVILLERIDSLGKMGEVVKVRPGYARNYLLPQKKALRATKDNVAYFESQRAALEKLSNEKKKEAEKVAKKLEGLKVSVIRLAAESGQLFGSVSSRDVADAISGESGIAVERNQVFINQAFKTIGLFPVTVALHPEVKVSVTVNVARSQEEAKVQAKTGKALIVEVGASAKESAEEDAKSAFLDKEAAESEKKRVAAEAEENAEEAEKSAKKSKARAGRKAAKKSEEDAEESSSEE